MNTPNSPNETPDNTQKRSQEDEEDHKEEEGDNTPQLSHEVVTKKHQADALFAQQHYEHSVALYYHILEEIDRIPRKNMSPEVSTSTVDMLVVCLLNVSCCFLQMKEWAQCVTTCDELLHSSASYSPEQRTRCLYFKAYSLLQWFHATTKKETLQLAQNCCEEITNIAKNTPNFADKALLSQVEPLLGGITQALKKATSDVEASTTSGSHDATEDSLPNDRDLTALIHEGTRLLTMNQPMKAIQTFKRCLTKLSKEGEDIRPETITCYQSMGDCYCRLQEYDEAISMYEKACGCLDDDDFGTSGDSDMSAISRARALQVKAGDCAFKSSSSPNSALTPESDISRAIDYYSSAIMHLPEDRKERDEALRSGGHASNVHQVTTTLQIEGSALQGLAHCQFWKKEYSLSANNARSAVEMIQHVIDMEDTNAYALFHDVKEEKNTTKNANDVNHNNPQKHEYVWHNQMKNYEILIFSTFYMGNLQKSLDMLEECFMFSSKYLSSNTERAALIPLKRNRVILKLLLLKNQILLQMACYDVKELSKVWEDITSCGDVAAQHNEVIEAAKLYRLSGEFFMSQSGRSAFNLNDNTLSSSSTSVTQRASELNALSAKYMKRSVQLLLSQIDTSSLPQTEQYEKLCGVIHRHFISAIRVLFLQGVCADNTSQAQRHYEAAHATKEDYERALIASDHPLLPLSNEVLKAEYTFLCGDISHHLAFSYMRCGKLLYALEESTSAITHYELIHDALPSPSSEDQKGDGSSSAVDRWGRSRYPNEGPNERGSQGIIFRLRHAWGLMAVIRCHRREQQLSTEALAKVQQLQPGPVVESKVNEELDRLTGMLNGSSNGKNNTARETNRSMLSESWSNAKETKFPSSSPKKIQTSKQTDKKEQPQEPTDINLLLAYFILTCAGTGVMYALYFLFLADSRQHP